MEPNSQNGTQLYHFFASGALDIWRSEWPNKIKGLFIVLCGGGDHGNGCFAMTQIAVVLTLIGVLGLYLRWIARS